MLTHKRLLTVLHYNKLTGVFTWLIKPSRRYPIGMQAGSKKKHRISIGINHIEYKAHTLAWFYITKRWPKELDHKDGNGFNNKFKNLRKATREQNMRNRGKPKNNKSGYKGVTFKKQTGRYSAQIIVMRKAIHLGYFDNPKNANYAYQKAAKIYHREFVRG